MKIESIEIVDEEDVLNTNKIEYPCSVCAKWQGRKDDCTKYKRCAGWKKWYKGAWEEIRKSAEALRGTGEENESGERRVENERQ